MMKNVPLSLVCLLGLLYLPAPCLARQVSLSTSIFATPGQKVTVKLDIDDAEGIESVDLRLRYPADYLGIAPDGVRTGVLTTNAFLAVNVQDTEGQVIIGLALVRALAPGKGSLLELDFRVRSSAPGGNAPIDLESVSLNEDGLPLSPAPAPGPDPTDGSITVLAPEIEVFPDACDIGEVEVGKKGTCVVEVRNLGKAPLTVTAVSLQAGSSPDFEHDASALFDVLPGQSRAITVTYRPREGGEDRGSLQVESEDQDEGRVTVPLSGRGKQLSGSPFRRGDVDANAKVEVTDVVVLLGHLFLGQQKPECLDAADADDDGKADISDAVWSLGYQFLGGPAPLPPGPRSCGPDVDLEAPELGCDPGCA